MKELMQAWIKAWEPILSSVGTNIPAFVALGLGTFLLVHDADRIGLHVSGGILLVCGLLLLHVPAFKKG